MKRSLRFVLAALLLTIFFVSSVLMVSAFATVDQSALSCTNFSASGTSDQPYVSIYAFNNVTADEVFAIVPVTGGTFSGSVSFPAATAGTAFDVEVWGTVNLYTNIGDPGYWDFGGFYATTIPCTQAPENCPYPLPTDSVVYDVPLGAPAFFAPDLQSSASFDLPAGTWKISEFDGDFAKVWIACEATPIWIPKNAVGGIVG